MEDDEESRKKYPFSFRLEIGYQLMKHGVKVMWRVKNPAEKPLYFSIGAHPAFNCPLREGEEQTSYYIHFMDKEGKDVTSFVNTIFGQGGTVTTKKGTVELVHGIMPLAEDTFDHDAKVIEHNQVHRVALLDPNGKEYLATIGHMGIFLSSVPKIFWVHLHFKGHIR